MQEEKLYVGDGRINVFNILTKELTDRLVEDKCIGGSRSILPVTHREGVCLDKVKTDIYITGGLMRDDMDCW